uniref:Uncharacterized protein n=1 Tax=Oryza glumipatula TaxID=40148 RepID=A0A0D9ZHA5_9ORYZ
MECTWQELLDGLEEEPEHSLAMVDPNPGATMQDQRCRTRRGGPAIQETVAAALTDGVQRKWLNQLGSHRF